MSAPEITTIPLSVVDERDLVQLENVVESGLATFISVGTALTEIRDRRLYRCTHDTFASYMADRWNISESRGYQLIGAARVATVVEAAGFKPPANEAQARELSGLNDSEVRAAYESAVEASRTTGSRMTAATVREARQQTLPDPARRPSCPTASGDLSSRRRGRRRPSGVWSGMTGSMTTIKNWPGDTVATSSASSRICKESCTPSTAATRARPRPRLAGRPRSRSRSASTRPPSR